MFLVVCLAVGRYCRFSEGTTVPASAECPVPLLFPLGKEQLQEPSQCPLAPPHPQASEMRFGVKSVCLDTWLPKGRREWEGWTGRLGSADENYYTQN